MSLGLRTRSRHRPELPLVPLIDVLVMLVFFTFATMQFRERTVAALNLTLPKVETAGRNEFSSPIVIGIDKGGAMTFNGKPATDEQLNGLIRSIAAQSNDVTVLIKADETTALNKVTSVMDACRKEGLNKIRLQSR